MPLLRVALAQVNPTVGDLAGNADLVRRWSRRAAQAGARLVAFPELVLTGYPVEDLVFRESFVAASRTALTRLATDLAGDGLGGLPVLVGYLDADGPVRAAAGTARDRGPRNALALLHRGRVVCRYYKHHLPNYGVFDEDRYFVPGDTLRVVRLGALAGPAGATAVEDTTVGGDGTVGADGSGGAVVDTGPTDDRSAPDTGGGAVDVALTVCEDLWQPGGPFTAARAARVGLVVTVNGSPFELHKGDRRLPLVADRAAEAGATVAYVNMVGGQDELVFDGDSMIVDPAGRLLARADVFTEQLLVHDLVVPPAGEPAAAGGQALAGEPAAAGGQALAGGQAAAGDGTGPAATPMPVSRVEEPAELTPPPGPAAVAGVADPLPAEPQVWQALVLGLRDYVRKNGFSSVVLGLSGGIDSSVVATLAVDALGPHQVVGVCMPSRHSSSHSRQDAQELADRTGLTFRTEPIQPVVDAYLTQLSLSGLALENLQARVRGVILMAISNQENHLALTTGNKSELAVGYTTLYGDSVGGFNPLKDVPKTMVWRLARWRNHRASEAGEVPPVPERAITKAPSAELRPGQRDTDSLPPYELLDGILAGYVDGDLGRDGLIGAGYDPAVVDRVIRLVDRAEYKRRQSAPGPKISIKAFGRDRRLPLTNRFH